MFKVNKKNARTMSYLFLLFVFLTLNKYTLAGYDSKKLFSRSLAPFHFERLAFSINIHIENQIMLIVIHNGEMS